MKVFTLVFKVKIEMRSYLIKLGLIRHRKGEDLETHTEEKVM